MAQFDFLIVFPLMSSLFVTLNVYYYVFMLIEISNYCEVKKFRKKALNLVFYYLIFEKNKKGLNVKNSYKKVVSTEL